MQERQRFILHALGYFRPEIGQPVTDARPRLGLRDRLHQRLAVDGFVGVPALGGRDAGRSTSGRAPAGRDPAACAGSAGVPIGSSSIHTPRWSRSSYASTVTAAATDGSCSFSSGADDIRTDPRISLRPRARSPHRRTRPCATGAPRSPAAEPRRGCRVRRSWMPAKPLARRAVNEHRSPDQKHRQQGRETGYRRDHIAGTDPAAAYRPHTAAADIPTSLRKQPAAAPGTASARMNARRRPGAVCVSSTTRRFKIALPKPHPNRPSRIV